MTCFATIARKASAVLSACCFLSGVGPTRTAHAETYVNEEYGFSVEVPSGLATCDLRNWVHNTGVSIILDDGSPECHGPERHPTARVGANYNSSFAPSVEGAFANVCVDDRNERIEAPPGLEFRHSHSVSSGAGSRTLRRRGGYSGKTNAVWNSCLASGRLETCG